MIHNSIIPGDGGLVIPVEVEPALEWVEHDVATTLDSDGGSLVYGGDKFIRLGKYQFAYSYDGINWTIGSKPSDTGWTGYCYANGKHVLVMDYLSMAKAAYSTDGITWTETTMPFKARWVSVAYGDGQFMAIARRNPNYDATLAAYSTDGINWYEAGNLPSSSVEWSAVCYGGGKFIAIGSNSNTIAYSTNGYSWTESSIPSGGFSSAIKYVDGKFIVLRDDGNIYHSVDGITWTEIPNGKFVHLYGAGKYIYRSGSSMYYSTDAINWSKLPSTSDWWSQYMCYGDGKFVAMYYNGTKVAILEPTYKELA